MKEQGITITSITGILPLVGILVAVLLAWATLSNQNASNTDKINDINSDVQEVKSDTQETKEQVIKIATIIEEAQRRGQLGLAETRTIAVVSTPTPPPPQFTTVESTVITQPQPTQTQTSTSSDPTPVQVLTSIVRSLGLL